MNPIWLLFILMIAKCTAGPFSFVLDNGMVKAYDDGGSGSSEDLSIWFPTTSTTLYSLGVVAMRGKNSRPTNILMAIGGTYGVEYIQPTGFTKKWDDGGTGSSNDFSFWLAICPAGFVPMGAWAPRSHGQPAVTVMNCVKSSFARQTQIIDNHIWWDKGSGSGNDVSIWPIQDNPNAWFASGYSKPNDAVYAPHNVCPAFNYTNAGDVQECASVSPTNSCNFDCASGFATSTGERGAANCFADTSWEHSVCSRLPCGNPSIDHSDGDLCTGKAFDASCTVACDQGYTLGGNALITCKEGPSWSSLPTCAETSCAGVHTVPFLKPDLKDCIDKGVPGVTCEVDCLDGYELREGDRDAVSCAFGVWSNRPECIATPCDTPDVDHSNSGECAGVTEVGEECSIECDDGYIFADGTTDPMTLTCQLKPKWDVLPECVQKPCEPLQIAHSHTVCASTEVTDTCQVECDTGYEIVGDINIIQCLFGGVWNMNIECAETPCDVPEIENSNAAECGRLPIGDTCNTIACDAGYEFDTSLTTLTCEIGPELSAAPQCVEIPCDALFIENSANSASCDTAVGERCDIECNVGYELIGQDSVQCEFPGGDSWSQRPTCELITCPNPAIDNSNAEVCAGTLSSRECGPDWDCDRLYKKVSPNEAHDGYCNAEGVWEDFATCEQIFCELLDADNSDSASACENTAADSTCAFSCNDDYEIKEGVNTVATCNELGEWVDVSQCLPVVYCPPPVIANSQAGGECARVRAGVLCQFTCEENFVVRADDGVSEGDTTIECNEFGEWVYTPNCTDVFVYGRLPEDPISDDDNQALNRLNQYMGTTIDRLIFDMMGLEEAKTEDLILNTGGGQNVYDFAEGEPAHTEYFNRQPFAAGKQVDTFYKNVLFEAMQLRELPEEDAADLAQVQSDLEALDSGLEAKWGEKCTKIPYIWKYATMWECYQTETANDVVYQNERDRLAAKLNELGYDAVRELRNTYSDNIDGIRGSWVSFPTAAGLDLTFSGDSVVSASYEYEVTDSKVTEQAYVEEIATPGFAAYKNGQFLTVNYKEETLNMHVKMLFNKWATVHASPGTWYDDSWQATVLDPSYRKEKYTIIPDTEPNKTAIWGERGLMNSLIRQIIVARDIEVHVTGNSTFLHELTTIYQDADSIRFGNICTGKACAEGVNIIIDSTVPGVNTPLQTVVEYLTPLVTRVLESVYRDDVSNSIAILGSYLSPNPDSYAGILFHMAESLGIHEQNYIWADGVEDMTQFFESLQTGDVKPKLIWFTSDEFNGVDAEESQVLTNYAHVLNNYTTSGGGLMAHGDPALVHTFVETLLPGMIFEAECAHSSVQVTHAGRLLLPQTFSNTVVEGMPCFHNYQNQFGNFDQLVTDLEERFIVLGAYGGITEGTSPYTEDDSNTVVSSQPDVDSATLKYDLSVKSDENIIIASYSPRFPHHET